MPGDGGVALSGILESVLDDELLVVEGDVGRDGRDGRRGVSAGRLEGGGLEAVLEDA